MSDCEQSPKDEKHLVDLWIKQGELFWRTTYAVPVFGAALFAGWYSVMKDGHTLMAKWLLVLIFVFMLVQALISWRMAQYMNTFRRAAGPLIPFVPLNRFVPPGYITGTAVPIMLLLTCVLLFIYSPDLADKSKVASPDKTSLAEPSLPSDGVVPDSSELSARHLDHAAD